MREYDKDREVIEAATEGPWKHDGDSELGLLGDVTVWANTDAVAIQVTDTGSDGYLCNMDNDVNPHHNAEFISRARTRWPAALAELESLQRDNALLLKILDAVTTPERCDAGALRRPYLGCECALCLALVDWGKRKSVERKEQGE